VSANDSAVAAARIEAERARAQFMHTANALQARLKPSTLAQNAWSGAKEKGAAAAENTVDAVRRRPLAATGILAALTLFLVREPLKDLAGKFRGRRADGEDTNRTDNEEEPQDTETA
jgi:ElaB/YqjD/DUF883 family membrane-anchored ribosome-binding protein